MSYSQLFHVAFKSEASCSIKVILCITTGLLSTFSVMLCKSFKQQNMKENEA